MVLRKTTIYLEPDLHKALRTKAGETGETLSSLVAQAVSRSLEEDSGDLAAFEERQNERDLPFDKVVEDLQRRGRL